MTTRSQQARNPFEQGPYLLVAGLCEKVLREADGVVSVIRFIDVITHTQQGPNAPEVMPEVHFPLTLIITLKSGRARGRHDITLVPQLPSGETLAPNIMSVQLEGEGRGVNILARIDIPYKLEGLYWFQVQFDGILLTKIPLELRYSRLVTGTTGQQAEESET